MNKLFLLWTFAVATLSTNAVDIDKSNNGTSGIEHEQPGKLLSRRKRFLVFPDGSSFQLVFCTQTHGYLQIGDIVWFGNTAALAWELPSDPELFHLLKKEARPYGIRRHDNRHITYVDEDGKILGRVPYRSKPIVNPAFAKRSITVDTPEENNVSKDFKIKEMHAKEKRRTHFQDLDESRIEFHRQTRKQLYGKIEAVLEGLGWNGGECVLRMLCETAKSNDKQGTLLEEIIRATFTLPRGRGFDSRHKYDVAHGSAGNCALMYPDCKMSIM